MGVLERRAQTERLIGPLAIPIGPGETVTTIPSKPFLDWFGELVERHSRDEMGMPAPGLQTALELVGWQGDSGARRRHRWASTYVYEKGKHRGLSDTVRRSDVVDALNHANVELEDLAAPRAEDGICRQGAGEECPLRRHYMATVREYYVEPDLALEPTVYCPRCNEDTTPIGGICPWCETNVTSRRAELPPVASVLPAEHVRVEIGAYRRKQVRKRGERAERRRKTARIAHLVPAPPPDPIELLQPADKARLPKRGIPDTIVREAMRVYLEYGLSFTDAAKVMFDRYPGRWKNVESLRSSLVFTFGRRGVLVEGDRRAIIHDGKKLARERELVEAYLRTPDPGYAYTGSMDPRVVWEAAWLYYYEGYGLKRLSQQLLDGGWPVSFRTAGAGSSVIHHVFKANGWPTRGQSEATAAANYRHGMSIHRGDINYQRYRKRQQMGTRPKCAHTYEDGKRCGNFAQKGYRECWAHREKSAAELADVTGRATAGRRRHLMPSGPFVAWIEGRVDAYGTQGRTAEILEINTTILGRIRKTGGTNGHPDQLTRRLIERALAACERNDPDANVPRLDDLYDIREAA